MTWRRAAIALFLIGLACGSWLNRAPGAEPRRLGGYLVLHADFHVHGFPGDGWLAPYSLVMEARRRGLHAFALTNHNQVFTARIARRLARALEGPTVLVGEEITAPGYHIIAVGIESKVDWRQPATQAIADVHAQGGVAIAAHPTRRFFPALEEVLGELDGSERMHPLVYGNASEAANLERFYALGKQRRSPWAAIGSSDYHLFNQLGRTRTLVFATSNRREAILDALRHGRTVVRDEAGALHGATELIRLLDEDPAVDDAVDYGYRGSGPLDLASRTCGWLGLLGLILIGRRGTVR